MAVPLCGTYGGHQFLNWWPQQSTGLLHLIGSNPTIANKKTTPKGGFLFGGDGGIWTPARLATPSGFRIRTLQPLGYISGYRVIISHSIKKSTEISGICLGGAGNDQDSGCKIQSDSGIEKSTWGERLRRFKFINKLSIMDNFPIYRLKEFCYDK